MLAGKEMVATIAVKDLAVARKFYEGTLGLKVEDASGTEAHTYRSAGTRLIVYRSQFAGTNQATALNIMVGADIDGIVKGLRDRTEDADIRRGLESQPVVREMLEWLGR